MIAFQFHTELFEFRARAMQALSAAGFDWFLDYTSVDLDHERFGIEVCGIQEEPKAEQILSALRPAFPSWGYSEIWEQYSGSRDLGWVLENLGSPLFDLEGGRLIAYYWETTGQLKASFFWFGREVASDN